MSKMTLSSHTPPRALAWIVFWSAMLAGSMWCVAAIYGPGALLLTWIAAGAAYNCKGVSLQWEVPDEEDDHQKGLEG